MIKEVKNVEDANKCDELLTKLILDERKYNDLIDNNIVIKKLIIYMCITSIPFYFPSNTF